MNDGTHVEGVEYTPEAVEAARGELITLRKEAMRQAEPHWAVLLSRVTAYLAEYKEMLDNECDAT